MTTAAQLADSLKKPVSEGYVAERHALLPEYIVVWAPCGCYWVGNREASSVTACAKEGCDFKWQEVQVALEALRAAEMASETAPNPPTETQIGIHPVAAGHIMSDAGTEAKESVEAQAMNEAMISEGSPVEAPVDPKV